MNLKIIYEDNNVIVIDKPAGISMHPKDKADISQTIVQLMLQHYPAIKTVGEDPLRPGIVHRLDKETSGLMVIAKNNETFFELKKQFKERKIEKKYIALVSGQLEKDKGIIETPLVKIGTRTRISNSKFLISKQTPNSKFKTTKKLLSAITEYRILKKYKDYTLVEITPKTGRQHQIRVHFASINHPIACDKLYGRKAKKCPTGLRRHFLHASYLKLKLNSALMEFEVEPPRDLEKILESLE